MEEDMWMYYFEDPKTKQLSMCNIKDINTIQTYRLNVPYDSLYAFDTVRLNYYIYFTGGGNPGSESEQEQYFPITMRMTILETMETVTDKLASMNIPRANHSMEAVSDKRLYVVGGTNSGGNISSCEEYDIANNKWRNIAPLNEEKKWVALSLHKDQYLYVFGGHINEKIIGSELIERLDVSEPSTKPWEIIKVISGLDLFKGTCLSGAISVSDDCILLFGGVSNGKLTNASVAFDPIKNVMIQRSPLAKNDSFFRTKYGAKDDKFAIVGSRDGTLHVYDIKTDKWNFTSKTIWNPNYGFTVKSDTY